MEHKMKIRYNSIGLSSIDAFQNVTGGMKGDCKEVCFVRALGVNATYLQDIEKMDTALITMMNEGKGYYLRINELPKLQEMNDISFYSAGWKCM